MFSEPSCCCLRLWNEVVRSVLFIGDEQHPTELRWHGRQSLVVSLADNYTNHMMKKHYIFRFHMSFDMRKNTACSKTVPLRNTTMVSILSVTHQKLPNCGGFIWTNMRKNTESTLQWQKRQVLRREENRPILHLFHLCADAFFWHRSSMESFHWKQLLAALRYHFQRSWKWINPKGF